MNLSFLDVHNLRMKKIGAYALLFRNSISKGTWKKYEFMFGYEQDNLIFSVLLYIMEQSLKEEICTIDHIAVFIDELNSRHFRKPITYQQCKELATFIVNNVLGDEGKAMYFKAYDYQASTYEDINISFIKNRMEYVEDVRRVTYSLTNDGYSLLLSTLEIEDNLKMTIHEMIFKLHLEKASYDKAVNDIKNIFNILRMRVQSMEEAIRKIKENPLLYTSEDYKRIMEGNIEILDSTKKKLILHRKMINEKINEIIEYDIHIKEMNEEEKENLDNLKIIDKYLSRSIDEDQRVLKKHFDLKSIYGEELESIAKMSLIERFNFKTEVYEKVLDNILRIDDIDIFLRPLLIKHPNKYYNINKALTYQKKIKEHVDDNSEEIIFDENDFLEEERKRKLEKLEKYKSVIRLIIDLVISKETIDLKEINTLIKNDELLLNRLIPSVEIFREVIIEMLKNKTIDIEEIREERDKTIETGEIEFQLNKCILEVIDEASGLKRIKSLTIKKIQSDDDIKLIGLKNSDGEYRNFICSNILFTIDKNRSRF